jgi:hypothetical protein
MGTRRILKVLLLVVAASAVVGVLSSIVTAHLVTKRVLGIVKEGPNMLLEVRESPNRVHERQFDSNGDGKPDHWSVYIRDGKPWKCDYLLDDLNFDGTPDVWVVSIGDHHTGYKLFDDDDDAKPDRLGAVFGDFSDRESWYNYQDLNLDGRFDKMYQMRGGEVSEGFILMNQRWVPRQPDEKRPAYEATILTSEGKETNVVFRDSDWVPAP